jgi:mannose-6-phosphate isomerase-like protein (cupin superfamily)
METWAAITQLPERDGSDTPAMLVWLGPDATELPPHVHTTDAEYFRTLRGEVTFVVEDDPHRLGPGEDVTVEPGREHYFRNDTDGYVAFYAEVPWTRTIETQMTTFGMDHEGTFGSDGSFGEPDFLQGLLLGEYLYDGTRITAAPMALQRLLWATVGRLARATGRQAVDDAYLEDAFWERHVEQPDL